jgi:hypothetical protein
MKEFIAEKLIKLKITCTVAPVSLYSGMQWAMQVIVQCTDQAYVTKSREAKLPVPHREDGARHE